MANINYTKPNKLEDFSVWCSKKYPLWCKSNFPFIEDTFEALDTYGLICKIVQYLNETKQNLNTTEDNVQNIYDFVTNYFDNLDVQNEINNKLDSMVSSGELQNLLSEQYDQLRNEVNSKINLQDSKIVNIESKVNSATSGSPAGVYDTLEDLMQENPSHDKIYVVKEDGEWYYWDSSINQWNNGGVYQAIEIGNDSVIFSNISKNLRSKTPFSINYSKKLIENDTVIPLISKSNNEILLEVVDKPVNMESENEKVLKITFNSAGNYITFSNMLKNILDYKKIKNVSISGNLFIESGIIRCVSYNNENIIITENTISSNGFIPLLESISVNDLYSFDLRIQSRVINTVIYITDLNIVEGKVATLENIDVNYRKDINDITVEETTFINRTGNLFNKNNIKSGYYNFLGRFIESDIYYHEIIKVKPNSIIVQNTNKLHYSIFDSNGVFVIGKQANQYNNIEIPENGKYLCYTINIAYIDNAMLCYDSIPNKYIPFKEQIDENLLPNNYENKKILYMGDSITALNTNERGWVKYFNEIIKPLHFENVAVSGAVWRDKNDTPEYDGNPVSNIYYSNVMGNQVQKVINNKNNNIAGFNHFDIIIIACGTNDLTSEISFNENEFTIDNQVVELSNVDRKTYSGIIRYCVETLQDTYPNVDIFICSPIQANQQKRQYNKIINTGETLKINSERMSVNFINTVNCGICGIYENYDSNGKDLIDGLHPNISGAKKIGYYNARKIKEFYI